MNVLFFPFEDQLIDENTFCSSSMTRRERNGHVVPPPCFYAITHRSLFAFTFSTEINLFASFLRKKSVFSGKDPVYLKSLISFV